MKSMTFLYLVAMLMAVACGVTTPRIVIRSINAVDDVDGEIQGDKITQVGDLPVLDGTIHIPTEAAIYAVKSTEVGYARTTTIGLTVQKGTSGVINFKFRLRAVTAEKLNSLTTEFEKSLTTSEKDTLQKLKGKYNGDLEIPWLKSLGINLDQGTEAVDIENAWQSQTRYNERATVAKKLLKETQTQNLEVTGHLTATGVSYIPTTVFSFFKVAKIYFDDSSTTTVLSKHPGSLLAATEDGSQTVPSDDGAIQILEL